MGKWNEQWMLGINNLIKLKVPVQAQFKDSQTFAVNLDKAEELNNDLFELKKKADALKKEIDTKQAAMKNYITSIKAKISDYDKSLNNLEKVMEKDKNKDGLGACNAIQGGLRRIEGLTKDPVTLKFSMEVK